MSDTPRTATDNFAIHSSNCPETNLKMKIVNYLTKKIPMTRWLPKYDKTTGIADLVAGITLGLTLVPQSIAYAALANLSAQYGLYSSFIGTIVYAGLGTIKEVSIGPTSLMALLTLHYCNGLPIEYVILLTFISGILVVIMGFLRLGFLVDLISDPVTSGFTSATSVIIIVSQIKGILGIRFKAEDIIENFSYIFAKLDETRWQDIVLGVCCCAFLLLLRKLTVIPVKNAILKKALWLLSISRTALLVILTATMAYHLEHRTPNSSAPFLLSSHVEPGLPHFRLPKFYSMEGNRTVSFTEMCHKLGSGIFIVPMVSVLANIAIAKAFSIGTKLDATQEMLTLGICNILGSCVQAMPTTGAFTRSAVSNASGVKTPLAGIYAGIITLLALSFLTQYFYYIPRATLSAILICAVMFMLDINLAKVLWRSNKIEFFILLLTFVIGTLRGVELGMLVGVSANVIYLIFLWARPRIDIKRLKATTGGEYVMVTANLGMFFLSVDYLIDTVKNAAEVEGESILPIVLDCSHLQGIDYTACKGLERLAKSVEANYQKLIFFNAPAVVRERLAAITSLNPTYYKCLTEAEMLDALFSKCDEAHGKMEMMPLLADSFRKKDSLASEFETKLELDSLMEKRKQKLKGSANMPDKSVESIPEIEELDQKDGAELKSRTNGRDENSNPA